MQQQQCLMPRNDRRQTSKPCQRHHKVNRYHIAEGWNLSKSHNSPKRLLQSKRWKSTMNAGESSKEKRHRHDREVTRCNTCCAVSRNSREHESVSFSADQDTHIQVPKIETRDLLHKQVPDFHSDQFPCRIKFTAQGPATRTREHTKVSIFTERRQADKDKLQATHDVTLQKQDLSIEVNRDPLFHMHSTYYRFTTQIYHYYSTIEI